MSSSPRRDPDYAPSQRPAIEFAKPPCQSQNLLMERTSDELQFKPTLHNIVANDFNEHAPPSAGSPI